MSERVAIICLLESDAGFGIELMGVLYCYRLENGKYSVAYAEEERTLATATEAADLFIAWRNKFKLGFDFEK